MFQSEALGPYWGRNADEVATCSAKSADHAHPEAEFGVLIAVAPQVGGPRTVAAAPELMVALGLTLPAEVDGPSA